MGSTAFLPCLKHPFPFTAAGGAPEGPAPSRLPAAEFGPAGSAAAEAVGPGEDPAGAGVPAPETGPVTAQPQAALLPQTVEAGLQEGHRVEGRPGGTDGGGGGRQPMRLCFKQLFPNPKGDLHLTL